MDKFSVIDLFAGAGGLSLGFEQTQKYEIKVAFENNPKMQETYQKIILMSNFSVMSARQTTTKLKRSSGNLTL